MVTCRFRTPLGCRVYVYYDELQVARECYDPPRLDAAARAFSSCEAVWAFFTGDRSVGNGGNAIESDGVVTYRFNRRRGAVLSFVLEPVVLYAARAAPTPRRRWLAPPSQRSVPSLRRYETRLPLPRQRGCQVLFLTCASTNPRRCMQRTTAAPSRLFGWCATSSDSSQCPPPPAQPPTPTHPPTPLPHPSPPLTCASTDPRSPWNFRLSPTTAEGRCVVRPGVDLPPRRVVNGAPPPWTSGSSRTATCSFDDRAWAAPRAAPWRFQLLSPLFEFPALEDAPMDPARTARDLARDLGRARRRAIARWLLAVVKMPLGLLFPTRLHALFGLVGNGVTAEVPEDQGIYRARGMAFRITVDCAPYDPEVQATLIHPPWAEAAAPPQPAAAVLAGEPVPLVGAAEVEVAPNSLAKLVTPMDLPHELDLLHVLQVMMPPSRSPTRPSTAHPHAHPPPHASHHHPAPTSPHRRAHARRPATTTSGTTAASAAAPATCAAGRCRRCCAARCRAS